MVVELSFGVSAAEAVGTVPQPVLEAAAAVSELGQEVAAVDQGIVQTAELVLVAPELEAAAEVAVVAADQGIAQTAVAVDQVQQVVAAAAVFVD